MKLTKTDGILCLYHLFRYCQKISYKAVTHLMPVSEKTVYRDMCLLRQGGVLQPRYAKKDRAFILPEGNPSPPVFPKNKTQKLYLEKIIGLCIVGNTYRSFPEDAYELYTVDQ